MNGRFSVLLAPVVVAAFAAFACPVVASEDGGTVEAGRNLRLELEFRGFGDIGTSNPVELVVREGQSTSFNVSARRAVETPPGNPSGTDDDDEIQVVTAFSWVNIGLTGSVGTTAYTDWARLAIDLQVSELPDESREAGNARSLRVDSMVDAVHGRPVTVYREGGGDGDGREIVLTVRPAD